MAPPSGAASEPTRSDGGTDQVIATALAPLGGSQVHRIGPDQLAEQLLEEFERGLLQLRQARGEIHTPEDTHETIRRVFGVREASAAYAEAFAKVVKRADGALEEELLEGVGGSGAGVPTRSMDVPLADGDTIRLDRVFQSTRNVDADQAIACLVCLVRQEWVDNGGYPSDDPVQFAIECIERVISDMLPASAKNPKVTAVEALATLLGHRGDDQMAAVARGAIGKTQKKFKNVKTERKSA
jgi:Arc/MetJ family transcription regulator